MTKLQLIRLLVNKHPTMDRRDVVASARTLIEELSAAMACGERIEVRGFGSFVLRHRPARMGRNPKTGAVVALPGRYAPHFKPGSALRNRVNEAAVRPG